jgi:protein-S-isoprenylcysteine O-methyltransferase Ste14
MNGRDHSGGEPVNAPIFPFPPVMVAAIVAAGWAMNQLVPLTVVEPVPIAVRIGGGLIGACAFVIASAAFFELYWAKTTFRPGHTANALVYLGVFKYSRNPIYLSFALFALGLGIATANPWMVLTAPIVLLYLQERVVKREETYLTARFGADYLAYKAKVRRWI